MELPRLGEHCSVKTCHRLDFLPMRCDACQSTLCKDHIKYDEHECPSGYRKNVQVPTCPLCNQLVPYTHRDQSPDRAVSAHIDRDCKSDPALKKREKIYSNKCSVQSCKQREAIKVNCEKCTRSFCLRHRFPDDHQCQGFRPTSRNAAAASDDASLALAMQLSLDLKAQEENDFLMAKALQESERENARRNRPTTATTAATHSDASADKKSCSIQ